MDRCACTSLIRHIEYFSRVHGSNEKSNFFKHFLIGPVWNDVKQAKGDNSRYLNEAEYLDPC